MLHKCVRLLASVGLAALFCLARPSPALAQGYLGANLRPFAVLAGSTVTCTGPGTLNGDAGVSPGSAVIGFPPCTATGTIHAANATAAAAQVDLTTAFTTLGPALPCTLDLTGTDLGGLTLTPGVYCFSTSAQLTGTLTLNALGNPNAVWVFRIGSSLITASGSSVVFINGGNSCAVQWRVGSSATLGTTTSFAGNILAQESITLTTNASLTGRALARTGAVTLDSNHVVAFAACGAGGGPGGVPPPFSSVNPIAVSPATLPNGTAGVPFSQTLTGSGGTAPFTFSVVSGTLPAGLTLTPAGVLAGTPTTPGTFTFTIRGTDATGAFVDQPFTIIVVGQVPTLPQVFVVLLALGLTAVGYFRLRRRARAE